MQMQEFSIELARPHLAEVMEGAGVDRCHVGQKFYRIRSTRKGSDRYGECEVCGKRADLIYVLTRWQIGYSKLNQLPALLPGSDLWGHLKCLEAQVEEASCRVVFARDLS